MVVNSIEEIPPLSEEAAAVLGKPEYQDPSLGAQLSDVRDQVRLHAGLRKGLIQISQTEWGADGSALAAISQEIGALITPDVEAKPQVGLVR